jgi:hypothetical protein
MPEYDEREIDDGECDARKASRFEQRARWMEGGR